jgi:hypothetical protein
MKAKYIKDITEFSGSRNTQYNMTNIKPFSVHDLKSHPSIHVRVCLSFRSSKLTFIKEIFFTPAPVEFFVRPSHISILS